MVIFVRILIKRRGSNSMPAVQLTFIVSETSVSFAEVSRSSGEIEREGIMDFQSNEIHRIKELLQAFITSNELVSDSYDEITLAWCTTDHALFPLAVFNEINIAELANSVFESGIEVNELDFNRIMEHGVVHVYRIPLWVKSFFVMRFPTITIQHERTMIIRVALSEQAFKAKTSLVLTQEYVGICVTFRGQLIFSNSFTYSSIEDIVYYLQFVLSKLQIDSDTYDLVNYTVSNAVKDRAEKVVAILNRLITQPKLVTSIVDSVHQIQVKCV